MWSKEAGLSIENSGVFAPLEAYQRTTKNSLSAYANIASFDVVLNGKKINNTAEEFPFLTYRNVTYFPMTRVFAKDEFGWDYSYDTVNG